MLCDECKKRQATVHTVKVINGVKTEEHLCSECAAKKGAFAQSMFSPQSFFQNFFEYEGNNAIEICKNCGTSLADFQNTGYLGCSECYDTFKDSVIPVLQRVHGSTENIGEKPAESEEGKKRKLLREKKEQLEQAISEERFEDAATIRDEINRLKQEVEDGE